MVPVSPEEIVYVARAEELRVELIHEGTGEPFMPWKDASAALRAFVDRLELAH